MSDTAAAEGEAAKLSCRLSSLELWLAAIILLITCGFLREAFKLPPALAKTDIGAGVFPIVIGVVTLVLAAALAVKALGGRYLRPDADRETLVTVERPGPVGLAIIATIIQTVLFGLIGAYATCVIIVGSLMLFSGERRWLQLLYVPLLYTFLIYLCFGLLLDVKLP
jgi:hypothetical protein